MKSKTKIGDTRTKKVFSFFPISDDCSRVFKNWVTLEVIKDGRSLK